MLNSASSPCHCLDGSEALLPISWELMLSATGGPTTARLCKGCAWTLSCTDMPTYPHGGLSTRESQWHALHPHLGAGPANNVCTWCSRAAITCTALRIPFNLPQVYNGSLHACMINSDELPPPSLATSPILQAMCIMLAHADSCSMWMRRRHTCRLT